ncbi:hypothetical protein LWI28_018004 [Acer negundo]|uniref:Uncharacterized protein n=1 Tax=Acer negundo TaxID=4023 RepID=A0AAD5NXP4_ACENE|nr:hypothetical protein LWI28_018004 [Acer negundo]
MRKYKGIIFFLGFGQKLVGAKLERFSLPHGIKRHYRRSPRKLAKGSQSENLIPEKGTRPPQVEKMLNDGPKIGPESGTSGVHQRVSPPIVTSIGPADSVIRVQSELQVEVQPKNSNIADNEGPIVQPAQSSLLITPKEKKTSRNWKLTARETNLLQIGGKISSPLQRMLEVSKLSRSATKRQNLSPAGAKKDPGLNKLKSPSKGRSNLKLPSKRLSLLSVEKGEERMKGGKREKSCFKQNQYRTPLGSGVRGGIERGCAQLGDTRQEWTLHFKVVQS